MVNLQIVMLSAPTSLASIMVIGPHHAAASHTSEIAPKWASGSTPWFGKGSQESAGLSFCVLLTIYIEPETQLERIGSACGLGASPTPDLLRPAAPSKQVGGFVPRDALGRYLSADPRRWPPAGGPVAGARLGKFIC
jgi:hypothetical protein